MRMTDAEFRASVLRLLASVPLLPQTDADSLSSDNTDFANAAALRLIQDLCRPPRVVVHMSPGADPVECSSDRPLDILELRRGQDLSNFYPDGKEHFFVRDEEGTLEEVVGHRRGVLVTPGTVAAAFSSHEDHSSHLACLREVEAAGASDRRFRIEWLEGYGNVDPEEHTFVWFTPERGFTAEHIQAMLELELDASRDFSGVTDRVRITRTA